ncbi:MAG: mannose-1-phosphate guanylyltransferase [bacterium]
MYAVLMAGGRGTRFWPKSREKRPKQLLKIVGDETMIQATVARVRPLVPVEDIYLVVGQGIEDEVRRQVPEVPVENILVEPCPKNTAPCIGLAAVHIQRRDPGGIMAVLPADHIVADAERFRRVLEAAEKIAARGPRLVTLGIVPTRPETGYGHIRKGERGEDVDGQPTFRVRTFVEKPDLERAKRYTESGEYLWNSGMFVWSVSTILESIRQYMPDLHRGLMEIATSLGSGQEPDVTEKVYRSLQAVSIDYGVMEKAQEVVVIPSDFGWNDLGSWAALWEVSPQDVDGNAIFGRLVGIEVRDSIVVAPEKLVAAIGIEKMIVIDTPEALLLCPKDRAQEVKKIVEQLRKGGLGEYL